MTRRTRLDVAALEDRLTPIAGGFDVPFVADPDDALGAQDVSGVVNYSVAGTTGRGGALIDRGATVVGSRHVLVSAATAPAVGSTIKFNLRAADGSVRQIGIPVLRVDLNPVYISSGGTQGDLAVVTLAAVAPFEASDYPIYTAAEAVTVSEVGKPYILAGYGQGGTGASGQVANSELQRMTITATGGQFFLRRTDTGATGTVPLPPNPTPAQIQSAFAQLGFTVTATPVSAPSPFAGSFEIRFTPPPAGTAASGGNVALFAGVSNPSTPLVNGSGFGSVAFQTLVNGAVNVEYQRLAVNATGGTYRLAFGPNFTNPIPFNATAADIQAAIRAVPGIGEVTVRLVTPRSPALDQNVGTFEIAFDQINFDIPTLGVDASGLAGTAVVQASVNGGTSALRLGRNEYDALVAPDNLRSDFDNDGTDDFGSGGVGFFDTTQGVGPTRRYAITSIGVGATGTTFGSTATNTRVAAYTTFIQGVTEAPGYTLTLDMQYQLAGNNGQGNTFLITETGGFIQVFVSDGGGPAQLYYQDTAANVASVLVRGSGDDDTFIIDASVSRPVTIDGGLGNDRLFGPNVPTAYALTGGNAGSASTAGGVGIAFQGVEDLFGGASDDTFEFRSGGSVSGNVDGQGGTDTVSFASVGSRPVQVVGYGSVDGFALTLPGGGSTLGGQLRNVNAVVGSQFGTTDQLTGLDVGSVWTHSAGGGVYGDTVSGRGLQYANFEVLTGGGGVDTFNVPSSAGPLTLNGSGGDDVMSVEGGGLGGPLVVVGGAGNDTFGIGGTDGNEAVTARVTGTASGTLNGLPRSVQFGDVESVTYDGRGGSNGFAVEDYTNGVYGSPSDPRAGIAYLTLGPAAGAVRIAGGRIAATSITAGFSVNGDADGSGDVDTLLVLGTSAPGLRSPFGEAEFGDGRDQVTVTDTGVTFQAVGGGPLLGVTVGYRFGLSSFSTVYVATGNERGVNGDVVTVVPSDRVKLIVDGQGPASSARPGDRISVTGGITSSEFSTDPANGPPQTIVTQPGNEQFGTRTVGLIDFEAGAPPAPGSGMIAVGSDAGPEATVQVYDRLTGAMRYVVTPFPGFTGGVSVASGDVNGDGVVDLVVGTGPGGGPRVAIFDGVSATLIADFFGYEPEFRGGVNVSTGDFNQDGFADIVLGTGVGGGPRVRILSGKDFSVIRDVFAYDSRFRGGVNVSTGDVNADGVPDLVTSTGAGGGPQVVVLDGQSLRQIASFFVFDPSVRAGFFAAAGDVNGDGFADIIAGAGAGVDGRVRVFSGVNRAVLADFYVNDPFDPRTPTGPDAGIRVAVTDVNGDRIGDIVTGKGPGSASTVRVFQLARVNPQTSALSPTLEEIRRFDAFGEGFGFGVFVGGSD